MKSLPVLPARSAFDHHHPPDPQLIDQCVHCGFCLPACPTYQLWGNEADSPRGRIYLIKAAYDGSARISDEWVKHFDSCLGCVSCMTACPSGVDYGKLIEATRAQIERRYERPPGERLFRGLLLAVLPHLGRLRVARVLLGLYQRLGIRALFARSGVLKLLTPRLRVLEALAPSVSAHQPSPPLTAAAGPRKLRVGFVLGCVQREFLSHINAASLRVLAADGCEVVAPPSQPCCGALLVHAGEEARAQELARQMIDCFERESVDAIVVNAAGCGSNLKEYGHLLRDDPAYAERARQFAGKCRDISELLVELGARAPRHALPLRAAVHDACHLRHAQRIHAQPRALLAAIPELQLVDVPEPALCCGSAGVYNLLQPSAAEQLADRKAEWIESLAPDVVATGNPGCLLQLSLALRRRGSRTRVVHLVELLDASLRGAREL